MTPDERLDEMEKDIKGLIETQNINGHKLDIILAAIEGDELGNAGFVNRLNSLEGDVKALKEVRTINAVYIRIITWLLAIIATGIIGFILDTVLHKK